MVGGVESKFSVQFSPMLNKKLLLNLNILGQGYIGLTTHVPTILGFLVRGSTKHMSYVLGYSIRTQIAYCATGKCSYILHDITTCYCFQCFFTLRLLDNTALARL